MTATVFDSLLDMVSAALTAAPAAATHITTDMDAPPVPDAQDTSVHLELGEASPAVVVLTGTPIEWVTSVRIRCFARGAGDTARPASNALAQDVYARIATHAWPDGIYFEPPRIVWSSDRGEKRLSATDLVYAVHHPSIWDSIAAV